VFNKATVKDFQLCSNIVDTFSTEYLVSSLTDLSATLIYNYIHQETDQHSLCVVAYL